MTNDYENGGNMNSNRGEEKREEKTTIKVDS